MKLQETADHIINWLKSYAENAGVKGFVVGVSGGIDSALTSTLCARTGLEVLTLEMPIHQHPDQVNRAIKHIEWLQKQYANVHFESVELTGIFDAFVDALPESKADSANMALVNTRARIRMTTLYYFAANAGTCIYQSHVCRICF